MAFNENDFARLIDNKKAELGLKAEEKKEDLSVFTNKLFTFKDANGVATNYDGDSSEGAIANYNNPKGFRLGGDKENTSLDAYETAKYNDKGELIPYLGSIDPTDGSKRSKKWDLHRQRYGRDNNIPAHFVTQELLNAEGEIQAQRFKDAALKGQEGDTANLETQFNGLGYFDRDLLTIRNPISGEILNEVLNTPENNASYFSNYNRGAWEGSVDVWRKAQEQSAEAAGKGFWDSAKKGVSSGIDGLQATGYGFAALIADATGNKEFADAMLQEYLSQLEEAQANGANLPPVEEIDWLGNPTQVLSKLGALIGEAMPSIALMLGTGGLGGLVSQGAKQGLKYGIKHKVKGWTKDAAAKELMKAKVKGNLAGAYLGANVMETGSIYGDVAVAGNRDAADRWGAFAGGSLAASLEIITPIKLMKKMGFTKEATKTVRETLVKHGLKDALKQVGKEGLKGGGIEGFTEALQFIIEESTQDLIKHGHMPDMSTDEFKSGLLNSFVAGLVPGAALRGGVSTVSEVAGQINGNEKVVRDELGNIVKEAQDAANSTVPEHSVESEARLAEAVSIIEGLDTGIELSEQYDNASNLDKALAYVDALNKLDNQEFSTESGHSTTNTENLTNALNGAIGAIRQVESGSAVTQESAANTLNAIELSKQNEHVDEVFDTLIEKFPKRAAKYEEMREIQKSNNMRQAGKQSKVDGKNAAPGKGKRSEVVNKHLEQSINRIESISKKLENTEIKAKHRKRLEQERNNLGLLISELGSMRGNNTSTKMATKISKTIKSFDYQYEKLDMESFTEEGSSIVIDPKKAEDTYVKAKDALDNDEASDVEVAEASVEALTARTKLQASKKFYKEAINKTKNSKEIKFLKDEIKKIDKALESFVNIEKQIKGRTFPTKDREDGKSTDVLFSLEIQSEETLASIDLENASEGEKALHAAHTALSKADTAYKEVVKKSPKLMGEVHNDVIAGKDAWFRGFNTFLEHADDKFYSSKKLNDFVERLGAKVTAFHEANTLAYETGDRHYINKETLEITDDYVGDIENYWFAAGPNSDALIELLDVELSLGIETVNTINKYKKFNPAKQQSKDEAVRYDAAIEKLEALKSKLDTSSENLEAAVDRTDSGIPKEAVKKYVSQVVTYKKILGNTKDGVHTAAQLTSLDNLKSAINKTRKQYPTISKEAKALHESQSTPKEPVVVKTTAATSEEVSTPVVTATDNMTTSSKEYLVLPESMWDTVMNNDGVLKLTTTDGNGKVTKTWVEIIHNPHAGLTKKAFKNNKEWKKYQKTQSGIIRRQKSGRKLIAKLHKEAIKADAKQSATTVDITPVGNVVDSYNTRFEKSKRKIRIKFDRTIKSLAVANPTQVLIKLNPEAIANDYEAGMVHIEGKSKGKLSDTSIQKKEVFKLYNIDIKAFKKYIEENGGLETYVKFIIEHELQHFRQRALADRGEGKAYPKDLMHPDALELEHDSNLAGFKAIGFVQYTKANKEARETTKLEQQLVKARDKFAAIMKEIEATVKDFKNNPAYIKAKKNFDTAVVDLKVLKQLGIEGFKAERARKLNNSILQKIKDKVFPLAESSKTTYTVTDIFKVKDINRTSFFSENTDEVLTGKSIAKKLKALGITDTAYIRAIAKNFTLFKDNFNANVLPVDVKKAYLSNDVYINNQTHNAFYVKDDSERGFHMPDEILFAMMLTTLQWTAINVNKSQIKPGFAIAKWALGDPKRVGDLSTKQYQVFRNQGIQLREAANDIGSEIMDLLNMHADTETKESLQMHMELMKYEAYASENMLLKDSTFNNKAGNSLALLALETARHMYIPKNKGKDIESGLVEIAKALYDKDLFDSGVYKGFRNVGKYKKALEDNTVLIPKVEDNVEVAEVLEIIRENVEGFELIKGAESSLKDVSSQPIKTVKDRVKNSFFDTAARANKLVQAVQNVAWQGKKPELSLVAVLDDATLENVVNIKDPSTVHITEREGIETANEEKLQDIQYVKEYLLAGKNKLKQFFLRYALQKQHRLRIDVHTLNPQRSKIIRGLIFPKDKDTTIGAKGSSNKAELDRAVFMVAVAQAFGYGVDKKVLGDVFTKFDEINSNETVQKLIKAINKKTQNKKLINKLMNEVLALEFVTPSMHVVEGVVALASYSATESFNTTLGMETDGVTNGYAISIMQFLGVAPEILKRKYESPQERKLAIADDLVPRFERIGVFIGKETDDYGTFEKFIASGKDDIYQALTRRLRITLAGTLSTQIATADALKLLHGDLVEKDLITLTKFARDLAKNPLMISNYGAGIARVIKDITSGFVPGIYKKLAEIQTDYDKAKNKTERAVVLVKLQEFEEALKAFNNVTLGDNLVEMIKSKAVDVEDNPTNLYSLEFDKGNLLKLEIKFKGLHAEPIKDALNELIGPLKESREVIIEAVENSFFAFMLKFKEATDVKPLLTSGAKELVANELAAKYMPAMTGPWARGENLIQLIKTVQESNNNKIQIVTKPIQIHTYKKESKLWGDPVDTNETTTLQISDTSYEFISPGTSVGTNMVQNLESVVLGEMLLANIDQMPIFDAKISSVGDTFESTAEYNKLFKDINLKHSFLKEALIQFDRINNNLTAEERKSVDADMKTKSFRAMSIAKRLSKETEPHKIAELDKQAKTLGTAHARARLVAKIAEVEEQHAALEKIHGTPGKRGSWITRVSQMFIHETLEKIASGEMTIEDVKNIKFTKATQSTEILFKEVSVRTFKGSKQAQEYARNNPDTSVYALRVTYGMDLPHVSNNGTLGNPWKVNKENPDFAQLEVGTAQEALEKYKLWLDGRFPEIFTPQHKWLMEQIDNGFFDGRTLVIASRGPNDVMARRRTAEVLAEFINKKSGNLTAEPIKILFKEDSNPGYAARTKINAASDATLAIAVDFNSAGEKLTKRMVNAQGNLYLDIDVKDTLSWTDTDTKSVVERLNGVGAQSLNIAGNGIYTMKGKYTQEQIDEFTFKVLKAITTHPQLVTPISSVNTGGQTGFDEAGAKAGVKLGLPTTVLAPKGWKFRNIEGKDVANKDAFMRRFTVVENVVENSAETTKQTAYETDAENVYYNSPELQAIGSIEQYTVYMDQVLTGSVNNQHGVSHKNSKSQDVLYHGTSKMFNKFNFDKLGDNTGKNLTDGRRADSTYGAFVTDNFSSTFQYGISDATSSLETKIEIVNLYTPYSVHKIDKHSRARLKELGKYEPAFTKWLQNQYKNVHKTSDTQQAYRTHLQTILKERSYLVDTGAMNRFNNYHSDVKVVEQVLAGTLSNTETVSLHLAADLQINENWVDVLRLKPGGIIEINDRTEANALKLFEKYDGKSIKDVPADFLNKLLTPVKASFYEIINEMEAELAKGKINYTIMKVAVNLENPIVENFDGKSFVHGPYQESAMEEMLTIADLAEKTEGVDGAIFQDIKDPHLMTSYLILSPEQIHIFGSEGDTSTFKANVNSQTDSDVLQSVDRKIKQKIKNVYTKDLQENLQNVFDELGEEHSTSHVSPQQKRKHEVHLQVLMDEIFSKAGTALNETTITLNDTDIFANGWANIGSDAVTVNLNKDAPVSHSEQTAQEVYMHEIVHILTRSALTHNTVFKSNIRRIRRDVRNHLEKQARPYELFLHKDDNGKIIYLTDKDAEIAAAKKQYKYVFGSKVPAKAVLDEFLAYALTNPFLVAKLKSMPASEVDMWSKHPDDTVIEKLVKLFAKAINDFINLINKKDKPANLQMEIFNLTKELVVATQTKRGKIMQTLRKTRLNDLIDKGNQTIHDFFAEAGKQSLKVGSKKYIELVDKWTKDGRINNFVANFLYTTKLAAIPGAYGDFIADHPKLQGHLDRAFRNFKPSFRNNIASFKSDIFGTVDQNFIELLYKSQAEVDINRHQYKSATREALYNAFMDSDALTDDEKIAITKMLLKTDFSVLESTGAYTIIEAIKLLDDPKALDVEIAKYAQRLDIANNKHYDVQTSQLANFMLKGKVRNRNQYKNAQVIFNKAPGKSNYSVKDGNEINDLDVYTTLLAIKKSETHNLKLTNEVIKREFALDAENNGITNIIHLHTAFKNKSLEEGFGNNPTQMSKGFIATIVDPDVSIEFASVDVDNVLEMEKKGYTLVTPFEEITGVNDSGYGIYVITNNPELTRTKGIASVKAKRASGFSLKAILARDETNIGKINGKFKQFARAQEKGINTLDRNHTMLPVIDEWGNITDYTVHMNHHYMEEILKQDLMFDEVLPTMFSQQEDKIKSEKINDKVIKMLHKHSSLNYEKAPQKFINILDPLYKEEYFSTLPKKARWLIEQYATTDDKGNNVFFVERGLLDTVFGYVNPSVSNLALFNVLPPQYKRYAKVLGKLITEMVALAKVNIVIKIPIVPAVNITSNFITSALYGVPPTYIIKKWKEGILELRDYQTDAKKLKIMDIEMQGNPAMQNNASVKKKRDILVARMNDNKVSWFIDKGLFNSITEDINQNEYTYRHKIGDKLKRSKAGTLLNTVTKGKAFSIANQAYMGEHTAVFKSMMHFTQMSDFIARYTLYKYNTEVKGVHPDKAWKQMVETFVNYDQPLNRYVQWTNDVGLIMFVKYWVRIQRAGLNLIKEKPLNVALLWTGSTLLDVDVETILQTNIVTGNFFPTVGGISMIMGEVMIPPGLEILSGEGF